MTRLTTKPDWMSLVSTLQGAHIPVRGHVERFAVLLLVVWGRELLTAFEAVAASELESMRSGEERLHAVRAAKATRNGAEKFVIETQR